MARCDDMLKPKSGTRRTAFSLAVIALLLARALLFPFLKNNKNYLFTTAKAKKKL